MSDVVELNDVVWSDWGNEERITETLRQIGKTPLFTITSGSRDQAQHPSLTRPGLEKGSPGRPNPDS